MIVFNNPVEDKSLCPTCDGHGKVWDEDYYLFFGMDGVKVCPNCEGRKHEANNCG